MKTRKVNLIQIEEGENNRSVWLFSFGELILDFF